MIKDEISAIKGSKEDLRKFCFVMFCALEIIALYSWWRHHSNWTWLFWAGVVFLILGLSFPQSTKLFYKAWMATAVLVGWFMSQIILIFLFYGVVVPISILLRVLGKNPLDRGFRKNCASYWNMRDRKTAEKKDLEKQF